MSRFREKIVHILEILVVITVVICIIIGLEHIGIFDFSGLISRNKANESEHNHVLPYDDGSIYKALDEGKSNDTVSVVSKLSREHVLNLLNEVKPSQIYYQELNVAIYDDGNSINTKAVISCDSENYDVSLFSSDGELFKRIVQIGDKVSISVYDNLGNENKTTLAKGGFDIQDDTGIIMTHERFFDENSTYEDDDAFYSVAYSEYGTVLMLEFYSRYNDYFSLEKYWLSLDYGVITRAECYNNDNMTYFLETINLNNIDLS